MNGKPLEMVELKQVEEMRDLFSSSFTEENVFLEPPTPQDPTSEPSSTDEDIIIPSEYYVETLDLLYGIYEVLINVNNHITILTELTETVARQKTPRLPKPKKTKAKKTKLKPKKVKVKKVKAKKVKLKPKKIKVKKVKLKPKKAKAKVAPKVVVKPKIKSKRTGKAPGRPTKKPPKVLPKAKQDLSKVKSKTGR